MKALLSVILALALARGVMAAGMTHVELNDKIITQISDVHIAGGRVIILYPGGGTSASIDKLPPEFLASWGIGAKQADAAKAAAAEKDAQAVEFAIKAGWFREVHGVVYDTRKTRSSWVVFQNAKVYQIVSTGALVDSTPDNAYEPVPIFVRNLPAATVDQDFVTFAAMPDGTFGYVNQDGVERVIRAYNAGRICDRSEIPETVLSGAKAFDAAPGRESGAPARDVVAELPQSDDLMVSGSGFFVSDDGYFITNAHMVRTARRVKIKVADSVFTAMVIREEATNDLALLKAEGHFKSLCVSTNAGTLGESVFTIGFPDLRLQGTDPKYTDGKISSLNGLRDDPAEYQISVPVQPGNSGGPLVDMAGRVTGVIVARLDDFAALASMGTLPQNVNYAIKGRVLRQFLNQFPDVKPSVTPVTADGAVAAVQQAVGIVLVY